MEEHGCRYGAVIKSISIGGVAMMFSTAAWCYDKFHGDRFIKCNGGWEDAKDQV